MATSTDQTTDAVSIWDVKTGSLKKRLPHPDWVLTAKFSPDDNMILTACRDRMARLWNWDSGKLVCAGFQHDDAVLSANFVRNGEFIFTCSSDQTGRFWEYKSGKPVSPPIRFEDIPYQSITTQFGDQVLVSGRMSEIFLLPVDHWLQPAPATDSFCMKRWGELLAGECVIQGGTVAFTSDEWLQRWNDHKTDSSTHRPTTRPTEGPR